MNINIDYPGRISDWNGFVRHDFSVDGMDCVLVEPKSPANGKPWYWRTRYFGAFPSADLALLDLGWHVAWADDGYFFGTPEIVKKFNVFHKFMVELGLREKTVPVGYSQGGLSSYNWAAANPDKVSCMYLDNPVCTIFCQPYWGSPPRKPDLHQKVLRALAMTREEAEANYKGNPVDNLEPLAKAGVPILHLCADKDEVIDPAVNTAVVEKRYRALGGHIEVIHKPEGRHHPHSLENPQPIVDFILHWNKLR